MKRFSTCAAMETVSASGNRCIAWRHERMGALTPASGHDPSRSQSRQNLANSRAAHSQLRAQGALGRERLSVSELGDEIQSLVEGT